MAYKFSNTISITDYNALRALVGWTKLSEEQVQNGLSRSDYVLSVLDGDRTIGMARVLTDGGCIAFLLDVIVHPDYQGKGIGREIMQRIMEYLKDSMREGETLYVGLMAAKGKEAFYQKFGFQTRPNDNHGAGMNQWLRKL